MEQIIKKYFKNLYCTTSSNIIFDEKVRDYCKENKCQKYNHSWCCPPFIKNIIYYKEENTKYKRAIIFWDTFSYDKNDPQSAYQKMKIFQDKTIQLKLELQKKQFLKTQINFNIYGAGTCMICEKCTYPIKPCKNIGKPVISMEAVGINVFKTLERNKLIYPNIEGTITYYGCLFYN